MSENNQIKEQKVITPLAQLWKIFALKAFLFSLTLGLGIVTAFKLKQFLEIEKIVLPPIPFWKFIVAFLSATLFIFLLIRFLKFRKEKGAIFKIIFILAVAIGSLLFLETWLPEPIPLIIIASLVFWWWKKPSILNQDMLMVFGLAGVGSTLGLQIPSYAVIIILIILSIYDWIAVYKTGHMVRLAKEMIEAGAIMALVIPPRISGFKFSLNEVRPGGNFLILGGGDVILPLIFCVSLLPYGIFTSLTVAIFSLFGLFFNFYIFAKQKVRKPMPALPLIALTSIIGYVFVQFIK